MSTERHPGDPAAPRERTPIDEIVELAAAVGLGPKVVSCRACGQKNRVSGYKALAGRAPRCGKCGLPL